jgi:YfiH family protein
VFAFQDTRGRVEVAFTDRRGDHRGGPSASLDLAEPRQDRQGRRDPAGLSRLDEALCAVAAGLAGGGPPPRLVRMHQVHGAEVHIVDQVPPDVVSNAATEVPVCDGLVTRLPGVALVARAADCVPVLLADPDAGVIGAAHAGRRGLVAGVVPATVARMRELGAAGRLAAWVGPSICGRCYEVPEEMRREVAAAVPEAGAQTSWGTPAVDVVAGVMAQLRGEGVDVVDVARCTREDPDLHSHRRDGPAAGRLGAVVWMRP